MPPLEAVRKPQQMRTGGDGLDVGLNGRPESAGGDGTFLAFRQAGTAVGAQVGVDGDGGLGGGSRCGFIFREGVGGADIDAGAAGLASFLIYDNCHCETPLLNNLISDGIGKTMLHNEAVIYKGSRA